RDTLAEIESYAVDDPVAKSVRDPERELAALLIVDDERRVDARRRRGEPGEDALQRIGLVRHALEAGPRGDLGGDGGDASAVRLVERTAVVPTLEIDRAEDAVSGADRHDQSLRTHETSHRGRQGSLAADEGVLLERLGRGEDELLALVIVEKERESLGGRHLPRVLEDVAENLRHVDAEREGAE